MFFLRREAHTNPLFKDCNIVKFYDKIALENSILIHQSFKHQLSQPFDNWFGLFSNFHTHSTRRSNVGCLNVPPHRTKLYGRNSVCISAIFTWNYLQNFHRNISFHKLTTKCLKKLLTLHFLRKYVWHNFSHNIYIPLLPQRLQAFCSIENGLKFYFRISLWHLKKVWWRWNRPS